MSLIVIGFCWIGQIGALSSEIITLRLDKWILLNLDDDCVCVRTSTNKYCLNATSDNQLAAITVSHEDPRRKTHVGWQHKYDTSNWSHSWWSSHAHTISTLVRLISHSFNDFLARGGLELSSIMRALTFRRVELKVWLHVWRRLSRSISTRISKILGPNESPPLWLDSTTRKPSANEDDHHGTDEWSTEKGRGYGSFANTWEETSRAQTLGVRREPTTHESAWVTGFAWLRMAERARELERWSLCSVW